MLKFRNRLPICALIFCGLLTGCGIGKSPEAILQTEIRYPTIPKSFQTPCSITPAPTSDRIKVSEGLALSQQLRKDLCVCALSYGDLMYLTSGGEIRLDKPTDAECPGISEYNDNAN